MRIDGTHSFISLDFDTTEPITLTIFSDNGRVSEIVHLTPTEENALHNALHGRRQLYVKTTYDALPYPEHVEVVSTLDALVKAAVNAPDGVIRMASDTTPDPWLTDIDPDPEVLKRWDAEDAERDEYEETDEPDDDGA